MRRKAFKSLYVLLLLAIYSAAHHYGPPAQLQASRNVGSENAILLQATAPVFVECPKNTSRLRKDTTGRIYVLNVRDSSVLIYDKDLKFQKRVGSFGQGPDDLRNPLDFTIDRTGNIIVADTGNDRIQIFSPEGRSIRSFGFKQPTSVDILSTGEILVVGKQDDHLISVFSTEGHLQRSIGELAPTGAEQEFPRLHLYLNRGSILVDNRDNVYWTGSNLPTPMVRKYSPDGRLLLQFHPAGSVY